MWTNKVSSKECLNQPISLSPHNVKSSYGSLASLVVSLLLPQDIMSLTTL